jgi:hypothetical protein
MSYTLKQGFTPDTHVKSRMDVTVIHCKTIHTIINKFWQTRTNKKTKLKCRVLTEKKLDEINARLQYSHQKSLKMPHTGDQNLKFQISRFMFQTSSVSKNNWTISGTCCDLCGICLWSVSLRACRLHGRFSQRQKKLTQVTLCLFCWTGWTFSGRVSKNLPVLLEYLQKQSVAWNGYLD